MGVGWADFTGTPLTSRAAVLRSLQQTYEAKRQEFLVELQKREDEMRQMFVQRVKEKESELKEAEREVSGTPPTPTPPTTLQVVLS